MEQKNIEKKNKLIFIVGPTASGKSALALRLADRFGGALISCDSMQIYKGLDIGTAKATKEEREKYVHYMTDIVEPNQTFSVAMYREGALKAIDEIISKGGVPIIVGGTGLYLNSLLFPMNFSGADRDEEYREHLKSIASEQGAVALHDMLMAVDAESAAKIEANDVKRTIRALEIYHITGKSKSEQSEHSFERFDFDNGFENIVVGLTQERAKLYDRINRRVDEMFDSGLLSEVLSVGGDFELQSMKAIGYREFADYDGTNLEQIKSLVKQHTRNYAKRQLTWLKRIGGIVWFDSSKKEEIDAAYDYVLSKVL